jgi:hypothetical protein
MHLHVPVLLALALALTLGCSVADKSTGDTADSSSTTPSVPECTAFSPEDSEWEVTVHGMSTATHIPGGSGWDGRFVIVDLTLENTATSEATIYWGQRLVDGDGLIYLDEVGPCLQLDETYGGSSACLSTPTLNPLQTQRGVLVFDVDDLSSTPMALQVYADPFTLDEASPACRSQLEQSDASPPIDPDAPVISELEAQLETWPDIGEVLVIQMSVVDAQDDILGGTVLVSIDTGDDPLEVTAPIDGSQATYEDGSLWLAIGIGEIEPGTVVTAQVEDAGGHLSEELTGMVTE